MKFIFKLSGLSGIKLTFLFMCFVLCNCHNQERNDLVSPGNTNYYVNPVTGSDMNSGLSKDDAWKSFHKVNKLFLSPGDRIEIIAPGSFDHSLMLKGEGTPGKPVLVNFAPGDYHFFTDNLHRQMFNISNTNAFPDSLKAICILLDKARNFNISGSESKIICRGKMMEVCIDSSENITINGLKFDYFRPTVSEFRVIDVQEDYSDIRIHKDSKYRLSGDSIVWYGEGWVYTTRLLGQELNPETNHVRRFGKPLRGMKFEELEPGLVRAWGNPIWKKDHIYQLRETFRDYAAVFTRRSKNITWKNVNFYFLHGMGLVSQYSENLTFDSVSIAPDPESGRTTSAWADCMQFSGCKGKILVENAYFSGAHDDAINIHGTHLGIVEKVSDTKIKVKFIHRQSYGFLAFNPGDTLEFIDKETLRPYGVNQVTEVSMPEPEILILRLEKPVPDRMEIEDVIENVTWTPEVEIKGCTVSRIPTRGFLLTTRRKILIEENHFRTTHMAAILVANDAGSWYESGYVRDLTIRKNIFDLCDEPVIYIHPENTEENNSVHQNIRIVDNEFILKNDLIVEAKSTSNLIISDNLVYSDRELNDGLSIKTEDCANVKTTNNKYVIAKSRTDN